MFWGRADESSLPGQRVSACTCKGEDHPGPVNTKGRGAPEIDAIEVSLASYMLSLSFFILHHSSTRRSFIPLSLEFTPLPSIPRLLL